jgi:hypothetical protein
MVNHIRHGKEAGDELPEEPGRCETGLKKIREAKRALEARAQRELLMSTVETLSESVGVKRACFDLSCLVSEPQRRMAERSLGIGSSDG